MTDHRYLRSRGDPASAQKTAHTADPQTTGTRCTCTGGPYLHGPEGLRKIRQELADAPPPTEEDTDDE